MALTKLMRPLNSLNISGLLYLKGDPVNTPTKARSLFFIVVPITELFGQFTKCFEVKVYQSNDSMDLNESIYIVRCRSVGMQVM